MTTFKQHAVERFGQKFNNDWSGLKFADFRTQMQTFVLSLLDEQLAEVRAKIEGNIGSEKHPEELGCKTCAYNQGGRDALEALK